MLSREQNTLWDYGYKISKVYKQMDLYTSQLQVNFFERRVSTFPLHSLKSVFFVHFSMQSCPKNVKLVTLSVFHSGIPTRCQT